jgi:acyl-CoA thioesterase I
MQNNNVSRRWFFKKTFCLSAIPLAFPSISSLHTHISSTNDLSRIAGLLKQKDPLVWLFTGDSITHGAKHTHGYRSYPEIFGERIRWEMGRVRDIVINTGISGNTTQTIINDFHWRIGQFNPSVVSLMIGTNDCARLSLEAFEQNLNSLLASIRGLNSIPIFHTPNAIIKIKDPQRARLSEYVNVLQNLTRKNEVILVDNYSYWHNSIQNKGERVIFKKWLNDPLHPNGTGHSEIAKLMFKKLSIFDPDAATCGGEYYLGH